jgi:predicted phosphodiesterase
MRIAIISDIHGNLVSFNAVLKDIASEHIDQVVFLGDAATLGPQPNEVIAKLKELKCRCILGNHDEYMFRPEILLNYTKEQVILEAEDWCRERLTSSEIQFLAGFEKKIEIPLAEKRFLVCYHGSPLSNTDIILSETPAVQIDNMLDHTMENIYAGGHIHVQMIRQHKGHYIINSGSVGQPFSEFNFNRPPHILPWAEYAILDFEKNNVDVILKRVDINKSEIRKILKSSSLPMSKWLLEQYS